nr:MAG TPA: hypothetical protein [Herelleviridae sp.]
MGKLQDAWNSALYSFASLFQQRRIERAVTQSGEKTAGATKEAGEKQVEATKETTKAVKGASESYTDKLIKMGFVNPDDLSVNQDIIKTYMGMTGPRGSSTYQAAYDEFKKARATQSAVSRLKTYSSPTVDMIYWTPINKAGGLTEQEKMQNRLLDPRQYKEDL